MAKKKHLSLHVTQEDKTRAQQLFEQYHQIANTLRASTSRKQAEADLAEINSMTESAQMALFKVLAKERHTDAADVLLAINELSPVKGARKEARRSLIQLQGAKIYPQWRPQVEPPAATTVPVPISRPRFWLEDEDTDLDEEHEHGTALHDLSPKEVVNSFVAYWVDGEYDTAYDLLSADSPLREGLSVDEWVERREICLDKAEPGELELNFTFEREVQQSRLWLPNGLSAESATTNNVIEAAWSIELDEKSLGDRLPEMPQATAVYEETGRHWFWASYTLVQEQDEWRIQHMTDEGLEAENLSLEELRNRIQEHKDRAGEIEKELQPIDEDRAGEIEKTHQPTDEDASPHSLEMIQHVMQATYITDVFIKKLPDDASLYEEAGAHMFTLGQYERGIVYLEALTQRFTANRAKYFRLIAAAHIKLSSKYFDYGYDKRGERFQELAERALRQSLDSENTFEVRMSLVEVLIDMDEHLDEAEDRLLQARALMKNSAEEAHIEMHLGEIAMEREQNEQALTHYQRVAELAPHLAKSWVDLAEAYDKLDNVEEAEANFRHAIALQQRMETSI